MVQKLNLEVPGFNQTELPDKEVKRQEGIFSKFFKKDKIKKPEQAAVLYLRDTGVGEPLIVQAKNGMFEFQGKPYHVREDCKYTLQIGKDKVPLMVQRECDLKPVGTKKWEDLPIEKKVAELQYMAVKGIQHAEIVRAEGGGSKMDTKTIVIIAIVLIVALAFLKNYI